MIRLVSYWDEEREPDEPWWYLTLENAWQASSGSDERSVSDGENPTRDHRPMRSSDSALAHSSEPYPAVDSPYLSHQPGV